MRLERESADNMKLKHEIKIERETRKSIESELKLRNDEIFKVMDNIKCKISSLNAKINDIQKRSTENRYDNILYY